MPTTTLTPTAQNTADFRKSFYDDDGDAMTVTRVEAIERDGTPLTGADRTPSWLAYTTSTAQTTEGPFGTRSYVHLDFSVPLSDPALEHGRTYVVEMEVTDGTHTRTKTFRFYAADFDLDKVSPMAFWISARKGAEANGAERNRAPGSTITVRDTSFDPTYVPGYWGEVAAYNCGSVSNYYRDTNGPVLPKEDPTVAVSIYLVFQETDTSTTTFDVLRQNGGSRSWALSLKSNKLTVSKQLDYTWTSPAAVKGDTETVLFEYHRDPTGAVEYRVNGAVVYTGVETDAYADGDFEYVNHLYSHWNDLAVYTGELTPEQKLWVRRKYKQLYYDHLAIDPASL